MNTSQMLALVGRIEELSAKLALSNDENSRLNIEVIGLNEAIDNMRREIDDLNQCRQNEHDAYLTLKSELENMKDLITEMPVTVQLPNLDDHPHLRIPLIKFIRRYGGFGVSVNGLKEAKDAVEFRQRVALPAAIAHDYWKLIAELPPEKK